MFVFRLGCKVVLLVVLQMAFSLAMLADGLNKVKHYTSQDGLSDNRITSVVADKEGFTWVATWAGLNRFDGSRFITYKSNPGDQSSLKSNRIDEIVDDDQGFFIWVKVYDNHIYRFDKRTNLFTSLESLISDKKFSEKLFIKILAVRNGKIWLKTTTGRVVVVDDASGQYPTYRDLDINGKDKCVLHFFYLDSKERVWISNENGLFLISQNVDCRFSIKKYKVSNDNPLKIISEDSDGNFWLSHERKNVVKMDADFHKKATVSVSESSIYGLRYSRRKKLGYCTTSAGEFIAIDQSGTKKRLAHTPDGTALYGIYEDKSGSFWLESSSHGVMRLKGEKLLSYLVQRTYDYHPWTNNTTIFEDKGDRLWVNIKNIQLSFFDYSSERMTVFPLNDNEINRDFLRVVKDVYYDVNGIIWFTTDHGGLDQIVTQDNFLVQNYLNSQKISKHENEIRSMYTDRKNRLWIGKTSGDILITDDGKKNTKALGGKLPAGAYSIYQDKNGDFWIGTKGAGVYRYAEVNGEFILKERFLNREEDIAAHRNLVYALAEDKAGNIWVGTFGGGLACIDLSKPTAQVKTIENFFHQFPAGNYKRIRHLMVDKSGFLWIGSTEGIIVMDTSKSLKGGRFSINNKRSGDVSSLGGNDVQYIYQDSKNDIWVLSSGGLNKVIGKHPMSRIKFHNYSVRDGLPSDYLLSCIEDDAKNLWITSKNGLSKFSLKNYKFKNYSVSAGMQELLFSETACAKASDGKLVFGNVYGYLALSPNKLDLQKDNGNIVFTSFQVNGENIVPQKNAVLSMDINYTSSVALAHDQNIIALEFAYLGDASSVEHNFQYQLAGFDNTWRNADRYHKIVYTNLPPGNYSLQLKKVSVDANDFSQVRTLELIINPPFWKAWWAYLFYTVVLITISLIIRKVAVDIFRLKQKAILERNLSDLKNKFFAYISHELRTPLTLIMNPARQVLTAENLSDKGSGNLKLVIKNAERMLRFIDQLIDIRRIKEKGIEVKFYRFDLIKLLNDILSHFSESIQSKGLGVRLVCETTDVFLCADRDKIDVVIYNLLSNAIKYSFYGGEISIAVKVVEAKVYFEIINEGPKLEDSELDKIFNLYYSGSNRPENEFKSPGIGLAITKEFIKLHNGNIYAKNNIKSGVSVIFELPMGDETFTSTMETAGSSMERVANNELLNDKKATDKQSTVYDDKDKRQILLVDDSADLLTFLSSELHQRFHILLANNGEQGLKQAITHLPDLIVTDVNMPEMSGFELLKEIKNNDATSHIPVILLTAEGALDSQIEGIGLGADYYLSKPFSMDLLQTIIANLIDKRGKLGNLMLSEKNIQSADSQEYNISESDQLFLNKVVKIIEEKIVDQQFNIDSVAETLGLSRSVFFRKFKGLTNLAPIEFVKEIRLNKAIEIFKSGEKNISVVAYAVGFNNPKYFSTCFKAKFGKTPKEYIDTQKRKD